MKGSVQAFQNSVAVAMCNRVGEEGAMQFSGESMLTDANGNLTLLADDPEQLLYIDIDPMESRAIRASKPYTTLRRPEYY